MMDPGSDDPLSGLAPLLRVRPELEELCEFGGAWVSEPAAQPAGAAQFHIVTRGAVRVSRPGLPVTDIAQGDILLLPHGDAHVLQSPNGAGPELGRFATQQRNGLLVKKSVDVAADTELICGRLHFEAASRNLIIATLPDMMVLQVGAQPLATRFSPLMLGIREELDGSRMGALAIAKDLASALFVMMLRAHLESALPSHGVLRLLQQRITAQAVLAMLRDPMRGWTLDALAQTAAASRATLVRAFQKAAGMAPMAFLADLRLGLARQRLVQTNAAIDQIAEDVGYDSPAAFSRAFLRKYGERPGEIRRRAE